MKIPFFGREYTKQGDLPAGIEAQKNIAICLRGPT